jgi:hypothetical protein
MASPRYSTIGHELPVGRDDAGHGLARPAVGDHPILAVIPARPRRSYDPAMILRNALINAARLSLAGSLAATAALMTGAPAQAATLTSHRVSGLEQAASCLTTKLCVVVGYNTRGIADVVPVKDGKPGRASTVRASSQLYTVSCPSAAGCWAVGEGAYSVTAEVAKIGRSGKVSISKALRVPAGVRLTRISCTSMTSCIIVGNEFLTSKRIEVGTWNGRKLKLRSIKAAHDLGIPSIGGRRQQACFGEARAGRHRLHAQHLHGRRRAGADDDLQV